MTSCEKQPPEVFCKRSCSYKFHKIHRKTPVPESLFKDSCRPQACNFVEKEALAQVLSCEFCVISKKTFFTEPLWWLLQASFHKNALSLIFDKVLNTALFPLAIVTQLSLTRQLLTLS